MVHLFQLKHYDKQLLLLHVNPLNHFDLAIVIGSWRCCCPSPFAAAAQAQQQQLDRVVPLYVVVAGGVAVLQFLASELEPLDVHLHTILAVDELLDVADGGLCGNGGGDGDERASGGHRDDGGSGGF